VAAGTYRLRAPLENDTGMIHVDELATRGLALAVLVGPCLAGVVDHGSILIFDPREPAQEGDFVVVELERHWIETWIAKWTGEGRGDEFAALYGTEIPNVATKLLRHDHGSHVLCALDSDGAEFNMPLIPHRIMGVVRAVATAEGDALYVGPDDIAA
jgi:hypothetical protein